ncbi:unnamed protein product [Cylicocyclus nassatus]|uniref:5-hydroxyisourate hydrolase n=1 Tax=Cylicocyclus nassatus TaxID=53992 RepID=A0AA36H490_CYLNA|nr:unnamed protein product [Cylicocyclus nassatus]
MIIVAITLALLMALGKSQAPPDASISAHVLDIAFGKPAEGVTILAYLEGSNDWLPMGNCVTESNGRVPWVTPNLPLQQGIYKLRFMTGDYYKAIGVQTFYPYVEVVFNVSDASQHYHVPLTLSPYGYSTYRGS